MKTVVEEEINKYFDKYSSNMGSILAYVRYKKDLYNYYQDEYKIYDMLPYIREAIDITCLIKLYGFFDKKYGLPLNNFLNFLKNSNLGKDNELSMLEEELNLFSKENVVKNKIIRLRSIMAHTNPNGKPVVLTVEEVEEILEWIKIFINKLHRLCGKSSFGFIYQSQHGSIFKDVLDVLKENHN